MKVSVVVAGLVWPVLAFGQQLYTNADLAKFDVPGAYTNQDLRRLPPLAVQKAPAFRLPLYEPSAPSAETIAQYSSDYDTLKRNRDALAFELEYELKRIAFSRSPFAGDAQGIEPWLGYGAKVKSLVLELQKRVALLDHEMEELLLDARRAGVVIDAR